MAHWTTLPGAAAAGCRPQAAALGRGLCIDVVRALCNGKGLPLEELHSVVLNKEGRSACPAALGARFVGSIELHEQCAGGLRSMFVVEEHFALLDVACCLDGYVAASAAAVVMFIGDVGLQVRGLAMLVQEAIACVMFVCNQHCGAGSNFLQGSDGKGRVQLASEAQRG